MKLENTTQPSCNGTNLENYRRKEGQNYDSEINEESKIYLLCFIVTAAAHVLAEVTGTTREQEAKFMEQSDEHGSDVAKFLIHGVRVIGRNEQNE